MILVIDPRVYGEVDPQVLATMRKIALNLERRVLRTGMEEWNSRRESADTLSLQY